VSLRPSAAMFAIKCFSAYSGISVQDFSIQIFLQICVHNLTDSSETQRIILPELVFIVLVLYQSSLEIFTSFYPYGELGFSFFHNKITSIFNFSAKILYVYWLLLALSVT
jgi:hypothetical protein